MRQRFGRVIGVLGVSAVLATSVAVLAPAAQADSRCNTHDHTHGALWWKRTDRFVGITDSARGASYKNYEHTNSDPRSCQV